ncbi:MAG: DNA-directed RNA polymerase subunit D [Halobacteriota archaeon]|nr:DNA-directed RNA polymerase subunit D [Halobacteriota archaeon]
MDIEIIELSDTNGRFILSGVSTAFANGIRRAMLSEVPTLAIDQVNFYENTSVLFDEQIASRMGLIPIKTDLDKYIAREDCECEDGCPLCQVFMTLSAESPEDVPPNQKTSSIIVCSGDLVSNDSTAVPTYDNIPIIKLVTLKEKNSISRQKLVLEAVARLGKGSEHAKWQAAVVCGYKALPLIKIGDCNGCKRCVEVCPREILAYNGELKVINVVECSQCRLCEDACDIGAIKVDKDNRTFIFEFETDGSLPAKELVTRAVDVLKAKSERVVEFIETEF